MSALQQSHRRYGAENPGQLSYLRHIGLAEERGPLRIKSAGEEIERHPARIFAQGLRIAQAREGMIIGDEVKRLALSLERDGGPHHAKIVADVEDAAGLDAGKDAHVERSESPR